MLRASKVNFTEFSEPELVGEIMLARGDELSFAADQNIEFKPKFSIKAVRVIPVPKDPTLSQLIAKEEAKHNIPAGMFRSIVEVESQLNPYAVNANGKSYHFKSHQEACDFVKEAVKAKGYNVSVGCAQLHYKAHGAQFESIEKMLQPKHNIAYGAKLLRDLYKRYGTWELAIKFYHTNRTGSQAIYYQKVMQKYKASKI